MKSAIKYTWAAGAVAILTACGGSGGGGGTSGNPLLKYEGAYYVCEQNDHSKQTVTAQASGSNALNISVVNRVYENAGCTGNVVGTYIISSTLTTTYTGQSTITLPPVTVLPSNGTVDNVNLAISSGTAELTGTGVVGNCVYYTGGNVCFNEMSRLASTTTGSIYKYGNYFVTFDSANHAQDIVSLDSTFRFNELVLD